MNIKNIFGFICMLVITILGVLLIVASSLVLEINSNGIMRSANKTGYFEACEQDVEKVLLNYMPEEKVNSLLKELDVDNNITGLINGFDSMKIDALANDIRDNVKEKIELALDTNIARENKQEFLDVVSNAVVAEIFPVKEFDFVSMYYNKYVPYIQLGMVIIFIAISIICISMVMDKESRKWLMVSLYNIVIFSVIIAIMLSMFNNIVIGSEKTNNLVLGIISNIQNNIYIFSSILLVVSILLNYFFYFKKDENR